MRRKRLAFFAKLLAQVPRPVTILDVGGTVDFWRWLDLSGDAVEIIVMNLSSEPAPQPHFVVVAWRGDPQPDTWSLLLQLCQ